MHGVQIQIQNILISAVAGVLCLCTSCFSHDYMRYISISGVGTLVSVVLVRCYDCSSKLSYLVLLRFCWTAILSFDHIELDDLSSSLKSVATSVFEDFCLC